jgi:tetratricopeptide (TPR) repeat protein
MRGLTAIGTLLLTLSSWLVWIRGPISGGANASVSFGWLAVFIGSMAGIAWFWRSSRLMAICGMIGLSLCSFSVLHLAIKDPALWSLVDENGRCANIMTFSRHYLPANFGIAPTFEPNLSVETFMDRLAAASYFMAWGWWSCLLGSLLILSGGLTVGKRPNIRMMACATIAIVVIQGVMLTNGIVAQFLQEKGERDMALGRYAAAIHRYEAAQRWNLLHARSERVYLRLGEAYYRLENRSHPMALFYLGDQYFQRENFQAAIAQYLLAIHEASPLFKNTLDRRIAWTYVLRGSAEYRRGDVGPASGYWERALAFDPTQLQAAYFLAKSYFDQSRYEQSIAMSGFLLARSQNRLLNANIQANIGDSYWRLNDYKRAWVAYEASLRLD